MFCFYTWMLGSWNSIMFDTHIFRIFIPFTWWEKIFIFNLHLWMGCCWILIFFIITQTNHLLLALTIIPAPNTKFRIIYYYFLNNFQFNQAVFKFRIKLLIQFNGIQFTKLGYRTISVCKTIKKAFVDKLSVFYLWIM